MSHIYCKYEASDGGASCRLRPTDLLSPLPPHFSPSLSLVNRVGRVRALANATSATNVALVQFLLGAACGSSLLLVLALLRGFFSGFSGFLPPQKSTSPNSNSNRIEDLHENQLS